MPNNITPSQFNDVIRPSVIIWAVSGLIVIPLCVYFDPMQGWRWIPFNPVYEQMMVSIYLAVGFMCVLAIRSPIHYISFLWFVAISSFTHGFTMLYHAVTNPTHQGHRLGDVWIIAGGLSIFLPLVYYAPSWEDVPSMARNTVQYGSFGTDTKLRVSDDQILSFPLSTTV